VELWVDTSGTPGGHAAFYQDSTRQGGRISLKDVRPLLSFEVMVLEAAEYTGSPWVRIGFAVSLHRLDEENYVFIHGTYNAVYTEIDVYRTPSTNQGVIAVGNAIEHPIAHPRWQPLNKWVRYILDVKALLEKGLGWADPTRAPPDLRAWAGWSRDLVEYSYIRGHYPVIECRDGKARARYRNIRLYT